MKIRTPRLMVAEKTSKLEGNQFLKVTDVRYMYLTLYAKTKFQTNVSKAKRTTNVTLPFRSGNFFLIALFPNDCLLLLFMPCDAFKFGLILIDVVCF